MVNKTEKQAMTFWSKADCHHAWVIVTLAICTSMFLVGYKLKPAPSVSQLESLDDTRVFIYLMSRGNQDAVKVQR